MPTMAMGDLKESRYEDGQNENLTEKKDIDFGMFEKKGMTSNK